MVDCHGRLTVPEAITAASRLAPLRLRWLEEPVTFEPDPVSLARVRRSVSMPIAAGELMYGLEGFARLIDAEAVDVVMPDVKHCGGPAAALEIARRARNAGVQVAPHNPSGPVSTLVSAHVCATLGTGTLLEFPWGEVAWRAEVTVPRETVQRSTIRLSDEPGIGVRLDAGVMARHAYSLQPESRRHPGSDAITM
jgi:galactonate dehydratase